MFENGRVEDRGIMLAVRNYGAGVWDDRVSFPFFFLLFSVFL